MVFLLPTIVLLAAGWGVLLLARRRRSVRLAPHDPLRRARALRRTAFAAMALSTGFIALFVVGETFSDPGGWAAVGLVSTWAVPLAVIGLLAWRHPDLGVRVLGVLVGVMVAIGGWFALDPEGWRSFEDAHGPVRTIATFALAAALALVALRRPGAAGLELVVLSLVPALVSSLGSRAGAPSLVAVASVPLLAGVLFVVSSLVGRHAGPPGRYGPVH